MVSLETKILVTGMYEQVLRRNTYVYSRTYMQITVVNKKGGAMTLKKSRVGYMVEFGGRKVKGKML